MAKTIGQLTQATTLAFGDEFVIEQSGLTKRVAASVVRGGLVNADIDAAAAIAFSKLAALDSANILVGNGSNVATKVAVTGDVTISNAGVTAIGSSKVVTAMITDANVTAAKLSGAQTGSAPIYGCRAWVNFDGTRNEADTGASTNGANVKIRASGNVSSVLKNGTGDYTITFTTALPDANYCFTFGAGADSAIGVPSLSAKQSVAPTTTALRVVTDNGANQAMTNDIASCCVSVFR
jgi:hypothetical protein